MDRARWLALLLFVVLAAAGTWPVLPTIGRALPGDGGDAYHGAWAMWWLAESVAGRLDLFDCRLLFYPVGVSRANDSLSLSNGIIALPLQWSLGLAPAYTILFLLSFALGGWAAYLLARAVHVPSGPALLAGIVFAFAPYHVAHSLGHLDLMPVHWVAFFFLALLQVLRGRGGLWPLWAGLFFTLAALSAWYYLLYLMLAAVTAWLLCLLTHRVRLRDGRWWRGCLLAALVAVLLLAPVVVPVVLTWQRQGFVATEDAAWYSARYAADIAALLTPPRYHLLLGSRVQEFYAQTLLANEVEGTVYLGLPALLLAWYGLARGTGRWRWWAAGGALAALVLALGPLPLWRGEPLAGLKLPYWYLLQLPLFAHQQAASRAMVLTYLGVALLAAAGAQALHARLQAARSRHVRAAAQVFLLGAGALLLLDYLCLPYPTSPATVPAFYHRLAADTRAGVLLELPGLSRSTWQYYQTVHRRPLINGYVSRIPAASRRAADGVPLFRFLFNTDLQRAIGRGEVTAVAEHGHIPSARDLATLQAYGVSHVILHHDADPLQFGPLAAALRRSTGTDGVWQDAQTLVFPVPPGG